MGNGGLIHWPVSDGPLPPDFGQHNLTGVPLDETTVRLCVAILLVIISLFFILPSFPISEKSLLAFFAACLAIFVITGILLGLYGYNWAEDKVITTTSFKAFSPQIITATVGVKIGLSGVNITLDGIPPVQHGQLIAYNNHFSWEWHQHRDGFSKYAGRINQEFRAAQFDGVPYPILWIAEYFVLDGEEIVWGRFYRSAGFYVYNTLLFALRCWVMAVILALSNIKYSGYFFIMTSSFILLANILYATISSTPAPPLIIPFEGGLMQPRYGWNFYLNLLSGLVSFVLGVLMVFYAKRNIAATRTEWALRASARAARLERWKQFRDRNGRKSTETSVIFSSNSDGMTTTGGGGYGHAYGYAPSYLHHASQNNYHDNRVVSATSESVSRFSSVDRETVQTPRK